MSNSKKPDSKKKKQDNSDPEFPKSPLDSQENPDLKPSEEASVQDSLHKKASKPKNAPTKQTRARFLRKPKGIRLRRSKRRRFRKKRIHPPTDFKKELYAIPNLLTYVRILSIPLIILALDQDTRWNSFLAAILFVAASVTDFFDGFLARALNQITILGKLLDPLADKLMVSAVLIIMIPIGRVPSWIVIVLISREFTITGLRGIAASEGMVIAASSLGKFKTVFQMLAIFCLLVHYPFRIDIYGIFALDVSFHQIGMAFLYISLFYSIISAFDYFWKFAIEINKQYKDGEDSDSTISSD